MSTQTTTTTAPLLHPRNHPQHQSSSSSSSSSRPNTLALLLGRHGSASSMLVRESAARQLEERRADWGYSKPVVALDITWNLAFVAVSVVLLSCTLDEKPNVPIRVWVSGYALQCALHVVLVWLEFKRRNNSRLFNNNNNDIDGGSDFSFNASEDGYDDDDGRVGPFFASNRISYTKRCENLNTMVSFVWWLVGFYWMVTGGEVLMHSAPRLYWLTVVFLAFDVFFAIFCVVLACLIGIALCCCLPCIIAILYAIAGQEGASEADLSVLPKYRFQVSNDENKPDVGAGKMVPIESNAGYLVVERVLLPEDAEFWYTATYDKNTSTISFTLKGGVKKCSFDLPTFRNVTGLALPLQPGQTYTPTPSTAVAKAIFPPLGYRDNTSQNRSAADLLKGQVSKTYMTPTWRLLLSHVVQSLGPKTGSFDQLNTSQLFITYGLIMGSSIDYGKLIFDDLAAKLAKPESRKKFVPYIRFISLMFESLLGQEYKQADQAAFPVPTIHQAIYDKESFADEAAFSSDFKRGQSSSSSSSTSNEPTSPKAPFVVKPPEKKHRLPSAYNRFMKEEIQRIKASNPQIPHREAFSTAAKNWAGHIPNGSISGSINTGFDLSGLK